MEEHPQINEWRARFRLEPHVEGGLFAEMAPETPGRREPHGAIYYCLRPGEHADFHTLDCDEYWLFHAGAALEIWMYGPEKRRSVVRLGAGSGDAPRVFLPAGTVFGARTLRAEPTLLTCVTVPRFSYQSYRLFRPEEMRALYPDSAAFFLSAAD